jgi:hypothetical protein
MLKVRILSAVTAGLTATALLASTALADQVPVGSSGPVRPGNAINVGDSMNVSINGTAGAGQLFKMDYPGGDAPVVINARIDGVLNTDQNTVGFDVFDSMNGATPVEHLTLTTNEFNQDPNLMEFVYSATTPGPVTFQFFNWSQKPVTLSVMPVQMPVALIESGPTIPGASRAVGISGVAGVSISRG